MLMLEATIGLNEVSEDAEADEETIDGETTFTRNDVSFLKSQRISLPEEPDGGENTDEAAPEDEA